MADPVLLLDRLMPAQRDAVTSPARRLLVVAGAGSGKTDVMARRVAWWHHRDGVPKDSIVAFTFTEKAAEELTFRIRKYVNLMTPEGEDGTLGGMYVGTLHGYCMELLRHADPDTYHNYDVLDEEARPAFVQRAFDRILGLPYLRRVTGKGYYDTINYFLTSYDYLNEYDELEVQLPTESPPNRIEDEADWCKTARLVTDVGATEVAKAFALSAARYYAYLRCRRFLDFSTTQSEAVRLFGRRPELLAVLRSRVTHIVVDEVQDLNPVQHNVVALLTGDDGFLTSVGDHRQAIYGWRGGRVDLMGKVHDDTAAIEDGSVIELADNFRSTPRIVAVANAWASTIGAVGGMSSPDMGHGRERRLDLQPQHVAARRFADRDGEAEWIADSIRELVPEAGRGAFQDKDNGSRGITYSDVGVLLRSSTDARTYMHALERHGIPAVFRAGPDLFAQPEVLLFAGALAHAAGLETFMGRVLVERITHVLSAAPNPPDVIRSAVATLRSEGLPIPDDMAMRLLHAGSVIHKRIQNMAISATELRSVATPELRDWLRGRAAVRRLFPQRLYHLLLAEGGVGEWESAGSRGATALFHLGQLSSLVTAIETPGWTSAADFTYQVIALTTAGASQARIEEAPLLVQPDAVTVGTIHAAKGLEYAAVFLADVCIRRFPNQLARRQPDLPYEGEILSRVSPAWFADNGNLDQERRLMYVALTRAERYLFVSTSNASTFFTEISDAIGAAGGVPATASADVPGEVVYEPSEFRRDIRLVTSFSDMRYYLECPHDFYLRKVLGFAPTIDQAFGYGRGVHNLMRHIHSNPKQWAAIAGDRGALLAAIGDLTTKGLMYLRYTTGEPAANMRAKAARIIADYVQIYAAELESLTFEPEREFETLLSEEEVLVSGAIDVIRLDDPPRVTVIDFKSGNADSDVSSKLDSDEMKLQVSLYGLAAKRELEYEPERGLVRYLDADTDAERELDVPLDEAALDAARTTTLMVARSIRDRQFDSGPQRPPRDKRNRVRCAECDFRLFCGRPEAVAFREGA